MKNKVVEGIEKICFEIADITNVGGKIFVSGIHFKGLAQVIYNSLEINEEKIREIIYMPMIERENWGCYLDRMAQKITKFKPIIIKDKNNKKEN